ncbi:unnamed protein product [Penicillium salamii]|nr:unnamed protein product [Penicillium salamii]
MSLQIVAVKEDVGFNRPRLRNVSFNTSNQVVYIVDQQTRQFLYCKRRGSKQIHCPIYVSRSEIRDLD